jgi:hypothetical protein
MDGGSLSRDLTLSVDGRFFFPVYDQIHSQLSTRDRIADRSFARDRIHGIDTR